MLRPLALERSLTAFNRLARRLVRPAPHLVWLRLFPVSTNGTDLRL